MRWLEGKVRGKGVALLLLPFFLCAPPAMAQEGGGMETKGLSPAALSIFKQQSSPAALSKKANKGDADAALMLGYMYRLGHKVKKDPAKAVAWFKKSANRGNAEGQLQMAIMYAAGEGVEQDYGEMRRWLQKSAESGYGLSQFQLGLLYAKGITVEQDMALARMWLGFAAEQPGEVGQMASKVLTNLRQEATAAGLDFFAAPAWVAAAEKYGKALAVLQADADKGNAHAQYLMGLVFGWLGESDANKMNVFYKESLSWMTKAAGGNDAPAQYVLGMMYLEGNGVAEDAEKALAWVEKAAESGYAPAQVKLGSWYDGRHAGRDPETARLWYERAQAKGNGYAKAYFAEEDALSSAPNKRDLPVKEWDARDQYVMALAYERGEGVPKDTEQATAWYRMAASQLLLPAQRRLGLAYLKGTGVAADAAEAAIWLNLAAEQGDMEATAALAGMVADGNGVEKDEKRAFALYEKAAAAGMPEAELALARLYRDGRGDNKLALKWFETAASSSGKAVEEMLALMQKEAK